VAAVAATVMVEVVEVTRAGSWEAGGMQVDWMVVEVWGAVAEDRKAAAAMEGEEMDLEALGGAEKEAAAWEAAETEEWMAEAGKGLAEAVMAAVAAAARAAADLVEAV